MQITNHLFTTSPTITELLQAIIQNKSTVVDPFVINNALAQGSDWVSSPESVSMESNSIIENNQSQIKNEINNPDEKTMKRLNEINEDRAKKNLSPINIKSVSQKISKIYDNPNLSDKEKKDKIEAIRNQYQLNPNDMKFLFTQRLNHIYQEGAKRIEAYKQERLKTLGEGLKKAEETYGKDSPQAKEAQNSIKRLSDSVDQEKVQLQNKGNFLNSLWPKKKGFWGKLKGAFKKIGGVLKKVGSVLGKVVNFATKFFGPALELIPGIGPLISKGLSIANTVLQTIGSVKNLKSALTTLINPKKWLPTFVQELWKNLKSTLPKNPFEFVDYFLKSNH